MAVFIALVLVWNVGSFVWMENSLLPAVVGHVAMRLL